MPIFKIVNDINEIKLTNQWVDSTKFENKYKLFDRTGKLASDLLGVQKYQLIAKKERTFSCLELSGRRFLGALAICCTLGLAFFSKTILDLCTKKKETIRFGIIYDPTKHELKVDRIKSLVIGDLCMQSYPCQHFCKVTFIDGRHCHPQLNGVEIQKLIRKVPEKVDLGRFNKDHFVKYDKEAMHS